MVRKRTGYSVRDPGRPENKDIKLPASAEQIARNIFANAKPVDPSKRTNSRGGNRNG